MRWKHAMQEALYGPAGFYTRPGPGPAAHFRTSVHASGLFAGAIATLVEVLDGALGRPDPFDVVDVGAGRGELLTALGVAVPSGLAARLRRTAVELAPRPAGLDAGIAWTDTPPQGTVGLLIATEWLDNVPLDLALDGRYVHVDGSPGVPLEPEDAAWLRAYWPATTGPAEIGRPRDDAWATAVSTVERGLAIAVDYGHTDTDRPPMGTLTGFRDGREVRPVPDGSCDITAHVALDSLAAASHRVSGTPVSLTSQRMALSGLGVRGRRPPLDLASQDPVGYMRRLATASAAAELLDGHGLGRHGWLIQPIGVTPPVLRMVIPGVFC